MNIEIFNTVIKLDLIDTEKFINLNKYITNKEYEYIIKSKIGTIDIPNKVKIKETEFYDLYDNIQIQKLNNKVIGKIEYFDKEIIITMDEYSFMKEYLLSQYAMVYIMNKFDNLLFMHGSSIMYKGLGIIFTAKSGVGKSTHVKLWTDNSDAININDDKNIIAYNSDGLWLYPNPWSGKHQRENNIKSKLNAIVFVERGLENKVLEISKHEAFIKLICSIATPDINNKNKWNKITDEMLNLKLYKLFCTKDIEAFEVMKDRIERDLL